MHAVGESAFSWQLDGHGQRDVLVLCSLLVGMLCHLSRSVANASDISDGLLFWLLISSHRLRGVCEADLHLSRRLGHVHQIGEADPYLCRYPADLVFLPGSILFSYLHGFAQVYALVTLHKTRWGSQQLEGLEVVRARDEEVMPLLRHAIADADKYSEPAGGESRDGNVTIATRSLLTRC